MSDDKVEQWKVLQLGEISNFSKLESTLVKEIEAKSHNIYSIIPFLFKKLLNQCINGFNFAENQVTFEEYLEFFQKVNLYTKSPTVKIIIEDCFSPVYFIGDTHGAIHESFALIELFFQIIQKDPHTKFVFIGDYVDRNPFDLENLVLIVAFSILCPDNVILLRGNHEDRLINEHYGFMDNLLREFYNNASILYDEIIEFFTHLPLAHISQIHSLDGQVARVMAVHGGIPINLHNFMQPVILDQIKEDLNCEVDESKDMDLYSISMLWSDPDEMIQNGILTGEHLQGRMRFSRNVFDIFMKENNLDLLVRGHQKWTDGYKIFFGGRLYSLFSTASYDGKPKFHPKILKLIFGQAPVIIPIESEHLKKELENYK